MDTTADAPVIICARCRSAPPMVVGMSVCKPCLQHQVGAERAEREARMRELLTKAESEGTWRAR